MRHSISEPQVSRHHPFRRMLVLQLRAEVVHRAVSTSRAFKLGWPRTVGRSLPNGNWGRRFLGKTARPVAGSDVSVLITCAHGGLLFRCAVWVALDPGMNCSLGGEWHSLIQGLW